MGELLKGLGGDFLFVLGFFFVGLLGFWVFCFFFFLLQFVLFVFNSENDFAIALYLNN